MDVRNVKKNLKYKHTCLLCDYNSDDRSNFDRHNNSKKHKSQLLIYKNKHNTCKYCKHNYESINGLTRHISTCKEKIIEETKEKYENKYILKMEIMKGKYEGDIKALKMKIQCLHEQLNIKD